MVTSAILILAVDAWRTRWLSVEIVATGLLWAGFFRLFPGSQHVSWWMAALLAFLVGFPTAYLAGIAAQARENKRQR